MTNETREKDIDWKRFFIVFVIIIITIFVIFGYAIMNLNSFKTDLKKCQDNGYKGIYWENNINFNWDCYKYKLDGEMLISHQPLD